MWLNSWCHFRGVLSRGPSFPQVEYAAELAEIERLRALTETGVNSPSLRATALSITSNCNKTTFPFRGGSGLYGKPKALRVVVGGGSTPHPHPGGWEVQPIPHHPSCTSGGADFYPPHHAFPYSLGSPSVETRPHSWTRGPIPTVGGGAASQHLPAGLQTPPPVR